jgi:hypothetical protein
MQRTSQLLLAGALTGFLLVPTGFAQDPPPTLEQAAAVLQGGDAAGAEALLRQVVAADEDDGRAWFLLGYALHAQGELDEAHECHIRAQDTPEVRTLAIYNHACVHALWGEKDSALQLLEDAVAEGFDRREQLLEDPDLAGLRGEERFQALARALAPAHEPAPEPEPERVTLPEAPERAFDFFPGTWEIVTPGEEPFRLEVRSLLGGRAVEAVSEDALSLYRFDAAEGVWRQSWIHVDGTTAELVGGLEGDRIVMRVQGPMDAAGTLGRSVLVRPSGRGFAYLWETSADGGATWTTAVRGEFRKPDAPVAEVDSPAPPTPPTPPTPPAPPVVEEPPAAGEGVVLPAVTDAARGYDFKLGAWNLAGRVRGADGEERAATGKALVARRSDGVLVERIAMTVAGGPTYVGTVERRFDADSGRWLVRTTLEDPEPVVLEMIGKLKDGRMVEYGADGEDGRGGYSNRVSFFDVRADTFTARQDRLYDDGHLESAVWVYTATRRKG